MTTTTGRPRGDADAQTAARMRALTAELSAAGLTARLHATRGVLDITAALHRTGGKDTTVTVDEDGYTTISYWSPPGAAPARAAAVIGRALDVLTGPP